MNDKLKNFLHSFSSPIAIALVGGIISIVLQSETSRMDKMKVAEQMLDDVFASKNYYKQLSLSLMLPQMIDDKNFTDSMKFLINAYIFEEGKQATLAGDEEQYGAISDAAHAFGHGTSTLVDSLNNNSLTSQAEQARQLSRQGMEALQKGDLITAKVKFDNADSSFKGFHSAHEISDLLSNASRSVQTGTLTKEDAWKKVHDSIVSRFAEKVHVLKN